MEPFKEFINRDMIATLGRIFSRVSPEFDADTFVTVASNGLDKLELKQRVVQVAMHWMQRCRRPLICAVRHYSQVCIPAKIPNETV